ncbi:MAG: HAMP domain-containing sensor histidine kinase [Acidimicrobiales bacterium]
MPVRLRLALLFAAAAAVAGAAFGYLLITELSSGLRHSVVTALDTRTSTLLQQLPDSAFGPTGTRIQQGSLGTATGDLTDTQDLTQVVSTSGQVLSAAGPGATHRLVGTTVLHLAVHAPVLQEVRIGRHHAHFLLEVTAAPGGRSFVVVGQSLATVDQAVERVTTAVATGGAVAVAVAALGAWILAGRALSPVERMRRQAADISEMDSTAVLTVPRSKDEIARLARTFNDLLARLHAALERERGFSAAAGHELRSPLALLRAELELAGKPDRSPTYVAGALHRAIDEVDRVVDLSDRLLLLSQGDNDAVHLRRERADLRVLVDVALRTFRPLLADAGMDVAVHGPMEVPAAVDVVAYRQMVENLLENAARHGEGAHRVDVTLHPMPDGVTIEVADDGRGFPPGFLPDAFERFSRADRSRSRRAGAPGGSGLGLSIVRVLAEAHGGSVAAANGPSGGAVVTLHVPRERGPGGVPG